MGKYRWLTVYDETSIATAGTTIIDLEGIEPISKLMIATRCTNNGSTPTAHPAKVISKCELTDGSDVHHSLSGIEMQALNFFEEGEMPFTINETENNVTSGAYYHINFGRYLWDKQFAYVPDKFNNPQLKITHNKASGGSAPDAGNLAVYAQVFDNGTVSPSGFMMAKEQKSYSLTSSAHEYTDLPTDYPMRKLIIQSLYDGKAPGDQYANITLDENMKQRVLYNNERTRELAKALGGARKVEDYIGTLGTGSAVEYFCAPSYENYYTGVGRSHSQTTMIVAQGSGGTVDITNDSSEAIQVFCKGSCPHGALELPFGNQMDPSDWWSPAGVNRLRLDITAGSSVGSSSTCEIVTQQLRRY